MLAAGIRDGALSPKQREHLVTLLHLVGTAASLAPQGAERYPDNAEQAAVYAAAAWEPVGAGYAKLLDAVSSVVAQ